MRSLAKGDFGSSMADLVHIRNCERMRASSYSVEGRNNDSWPLEKGESKVIGDLQGPGRINHIWFTIWGDDRQWMRKMLVRMYWDGEKEPSVDCPVGDFFGMGHCKVKSFQTLPMNMSAADEWHTAMNCWWHMPFREHAKIEIVNQCDSERQGIYFYIDWEKYDEPLADDIISFHAKWRRENPTDGWYKTDEADPNKARHGQEPNSKQQLTDEDCYRFLEAEGRGHFVGCILNVHNLMGGWWGEGDDMFVIDGEPWPPRLHGTGSEDYFSHAWGMQPNAFLYNGANLHEDDGRGKCTSYRFHIEDPIPFKTSLRASIEHSHGNLGTDDYSSVAYWYQTEPHKVWAPMPPAAQRLPRPDTYEKGRLAWMKELWGK